MARTSLPVHNDLSGFATAASPLRPSKVGKFLACPMSVILTLHEERAGGVAAQTGNLVHDAAEAYHKTQGSEEDRIAAGVQALEAARVQFPDGDPETALKIFSAYTRDKENSQAIVVWCEEPVRLALAADDSDPTREPIIIAGTLDQVRRDKEGVLRVWDIKTGTFHKSDEECLNALVQQAVYTLAARETLNPDVQPGGIIYTNGYSVVRGRVHIPNPLTVDQCRDLMLMVPPLVAAIRRGEPVFRPSVDSCRFCSVRPWPKCHSMFRGLYS